MTSPIVIMSLLLWATVAGVDLATVPQGLLSRPLVAATVAGAIVGNIEAGLLSGMVLELYALDVLPIGAAWYPDFGAASVAAAVAAAVVPLPVVAGVAGVVALPIAVFGGWTIQRLRRFNGASVQRRLERVAAGDARAIWELQRNGLLRDIARSFMLSVCALLVAAIVMSITWENVRGAEWLSWATIAGGLIAAIGGALRSAGQGARRRWYAVGLSTGVAVALLA
ncbi:MAG: PTS sugar transporter subunit IIC [Gemmatimonadales bacterium]|nr:PTS sugar transporter subunit IIC [Gemmatimonadales bacterium]